jgi:hypothetical protein
MKGRAIFAGAVLVAAAALAAVFWPQSAGGDPTKPGNQILARELAIMLGQHPSTPAPGSAKLMPLSGGVAFTLLEAAGGLKGIDRARADRTDGMGTLRRTTVPSSTGTQGCPNKFSGGAGQIGANIRVNQDCSRRRQAEEVVVANPRNPRNLIAGQNDSRIGFNHCGYDWSFDGGKTWGDQVPPFWQFLQGDLHTADACSDPTVTFDADGNAYVGGIFFDIASPASSFLVVKSNWPLGGQFYHNPAAGAFQEFSTNAPGVVASDNDPNVAHDKEFIVADANVTGSPKKNYVYGTWTRFANTTQGVGANSPIYFSQSTDGGATWSPGIEISGSNAAVCTDFSGSADPNACDQDQGSHPIVGKDGTIYVSFGNGNTPTLGINQVLFVSCPASADCSSPASWTAPVKVGDLIDNHPTGPSPEGCPAGRQCLPPNGYRVPEFTSMTTNVDNSNRLIVTWSDFRNGGPPCDTGNAATSTPPCNNDVFYAYSLDGGATWSDTKNITGGSRFGQTAQWQPWSDVRSNGRLFVAYYDRAYGSCESTGCNDITLTRIRNPYVSGAPSMTHRRVTTGSMPNLTPANNPVQAGFLGDYMWVDVDKNGRVHIAWADTRGLNGTVEEDIYYATTGGDNNDDDDDD